MEQNPQNRKFYRLRWRFDFNGKPSKWGQWSNPGNVETEGAWRVNKDGLVRAAIEAECVQSFKITTVAECDGADFVNFEWLAVASMPGIPNETMKIRGNIVGLSLVMRDMELRCYVNGEQHVRQRTEDEKKFNLAGFGR